MSKILGYCKECGEKITKKHSLKKVGYPGCYECPTCSYPNDIDDLWDELPDYLIKYRKEHGLEM